MSSGGTLVNFNGLTLNHHAQAPHHHLPHPHSHMVLEGGVGGGGATGSNPYHHLHQQTPHYQQQQHIQHQQTPNNPQLNMLDVKMSNSPSSSSSPCSSSAPSLSPVTPVNILPECYMGMWESDMSHPPPTKLETTDIMELIDTNNGPGGGGGAGGVPSPSSMSPSPPTTSTAPLELEPGGTSPTTIIHHTATSSSSSSSNPSLSLALVSSKSHCSSSPPSSTSPSSSSSSTTSSTSSSQYLVPLPSLGDPYSTSDGGSCHLLNGFQSDMDVSFHKLSDTTNAFQEGGYDAFITDMSQSQHPSLSHHDPNPSHHHSHHQVPCLNDNNGVLLLEMGNGHPPSSSLLHHHHHHSHHHPHHLQDSSGQCSPGCACLSNPSSYSPNSSLIGGGGGGGGGNTGDLFGNGVPSHHHFHPHHPSHDIHRHHSSDYSTNWDDLHGGNHNGNNTSDLNGDYSNLFREKSPCTSDSVVSYPDNDSESKSSSIGLNDMRRHHPNISPPPAKRKVGRPPKKDKKLKRNEKKTGRLWEFIRDLLKNPEYCPSLVKWENHEEGHFRFVNSEKVAQLWGKIKGNPRMTYEKLSRAMRYYYKSHVFEPVLGRRLVYKFGYNATNWKPINPNFANTTSNSSTSTTSPPHHHHPHHHLQHLQQASLHHHQPHPHHPYQHHQKMYN